MAETASRSRPARSARDSGRDSGLGSLRIHYYRRMKPNHVYPWTVTLPDARRGAGQEVTVRLLMAGAQVVPAEQTLPSADGQAKATFFVTPIAKGWLKGQRLEVLVGGRKVQEIPLASKAISQRRTLILLFLTFFVPWFVWSYLHFPPASYRQKLDPNTNIIKTEKVKAGGGLEVTEFMREVIGPPQEVKDVLPEDVVDVVAKDVPRYVGGFYEEFSKTIREYSVGFYAGLLLLILTLCSWFFSRQKSKTLVSGPIPLPTSGRTDDEG